MYLKVWVQAWETLSFIMQGHWVTCCITVPALIPCHETLPPVFCIYWERLLHLVNVFCWTKSVLCNSFANCMLSWKKCCQKLCKMYPVLIMLVVCVCVCVHACTTLEEFQMSGSLLNKIKIQMCSGCMQNNRALVFHRNNKFPQLCFINSHIILHRISWGMKSVCLLHTVHWHNSQQNIQQLP